MISGANPHVSMAKLLKHLGLANEKPSVNIAQQKYDESSYPGRYRRIDSNAVFEADCRSKNTTKERCVMFNDGFSERVEFNEEVCEWRKRHSPHQPRRSTGDESTKSNAGSVSIMDSTTSQIKVCSVIVAFSNLVISYLMATIFSMLYKQFYSPIFPSVFGLSLLGTSATHRQKLS